MDKIKLFDSEYKMMKLIWEMEPVNSTTLKELCEREYGWKKSTTYTIIKKHKLSVTT
jgi:predicted transcriptional regulator